MKISEAFTKGLNLANDLHSPKCIDWLALMNYYCNNGEGQTIKLLTQEKTGANNIYAVHLDLAVSCIKEISEDYRIIK